MNLEMRKRIAQMYRKSHVLLRDGRLVDRGVYELADEYSKTEGITLDKSLALIILSLKEELDERAKKNGN